MHKGLLLPALALTVNLPSLPAQSTAIPLDLEARGEAINPFIYGQFIEHLGRCIYGGIWAEMLEDRKFYYPITAEYAPYQHYTDTDFPTIDASPWEIVGSSDGVTMMTDDPFVGEHTPLLREGTALRHHDLGVVETKGYDGYVWLKAPKGAALVTITLGTPGGGAASKSLAVSHAGYAKHPFHFTASETSDKATFTIEATEGELLIGAASLMPDDNLHGMRADTLKLLQELDSPLYRWPGGNFVSGYDWRDGIGDRDRRPPRKNLAWFGIESNDFGTDEFLLFCKMLETVPMIAANTGFGDAYSAAQWVNYCNGDSQTIGGQWRIANGRAEPYDVKHWCVGNEMFGPWQLGFMQLGHYTLKHNIVAKEMLTADPSLELVAVGQIDQINNAHDPDAAAAHRTWSQGMLEECANAMNYISEHAYRGRVPWSDEGRKPVEEHVTMLKESIRDISDKHRALQASLPNLHGRIVPISLDEWNYWHREYIYGDLGCVYDLADGLGTVIGLHEFYRQSDIIEIANYAQTVNVIGAIKTTRTAAEFESTGLALKLYRAQFEKWPLRLGDDFAPFDVMAAVSNDGKRLTLSIVNPTTSTTTFPLDFAASDAPKEARRWRLYAPSGDPLTHNTPGEPRQVDLADDGTISIANGLEVPAMTAALFELTL